MKHIKSFNESSEETNKNKEFFKDKIDWNLFHKLQDISVEYSDQGRFTRLSIQTTYKNNWDVIYLSELNSDDCIGASLLNDNLYNNNDYSPNRSFKYNIEKYSITNQILYQMIIKTKNAERESDKIKSKLSKYDCDSSIVSGLLVITILKQSTPLS